MPGTLRAVVTNARAGGVVQGGSSITQQLAKNLFLSNERTIERKVKEAFLAVWLETRLTKNQILKLYLDRAYLGGGAYGVDAAAQYYFNKSARELNLAEVRDDGRVVQGADALCAAHQPAGRPRARQHGARQSDRGRDDDGRPGVRRPSQSRKRGRPARRAAAELTISTTPIDEMKKLVDKLPKSVQERVFIVRTGLDVNLQRQSEQAVEETLRDYGRQYGVRQAANGRVRQ